MSACLHSFVKDVVRQIFDSNERLDQRHYRLLLNLPAVEKQALAKSIMELNWNVGSPIAMKYLQKSNILSMSDMIVNTYNQNQEGAQLIFNDLLETEHMLLGDLVKNSNSTDPIGMSVCEILNEGFKRLCNDVIQNPSILVTNYLSEVDEYIPEYFEELRLMHLKLILNDDPKNTTDDSISTQFAWNNEITDEHIVLKSFLTTIVGNDFHTQRNTFEAILEKCDDWLQQSWKTVLLLLRFVIDNDVCRKFNAEQLYELKTRTKKFLQSTFRRAVEEEDENGFHVLFLVARQLTRYNVSVFGDYATWFKITIGEMSYKLKSKEFTLVMQLLAGMVQLESDPDILDVHINTSIQAAPRCGQLVMNYKQLCQSRQLHLQSPTVENPIVIDEDADVFMLDDDD
ncbi:uncharacterized protein LOC129578102 isoform X2 [Sitodiplosis mosellana]|uniref:uncharacterized protein LOC129578102 isoform X2 n=1 Tax=Sitodiplosis mosellana TaxID=263140 RepID=UPI0024450E20|nr:uncharacterized protein LOC129578102 isoform X2 [Sitodiplosis mosellana]